LRNSGLESDPSKKSLLSWKTEWLKSKIGGEDPNPGSDVGLNIV
jgi:hypothetical protein